MPILLDAALDFSTIWSDFASAFGTITTFIVGQSLIRMIIAIPLGVGFLASIIKALR